MSRIFYFIIKGMKGIKASRSPSKFVTECVSNKKLYDKVKKDIYKKYATHSAYRSGAVIKKYRQLGGRFKCSRKKNIDKMPLKRWFKEKWKDVNPNKTKRSYPVYRPTRRVTKKTPKTVHEISRRRLRSHSKLKQRYRHRTLPKF